VGGYPVIVTDTAGLRRTDDKIEAEGIKRAEKTAREADIKLVLFDPAQKADAETSAHIDDKTMVVLTKKDQGIIPLDSSFRWDDAISISVVTGEGVDDLLSRLTSRIAIMVENKYNQPNLTRARHRDAIEKAHECLARGVKADLPELAAVDMRLALRHVGSLTGRVHIEDILDVVFKEFCIGK
jgi:tRNA modification GTPase